MKEKGMSKGEFTSVAQANGGIDNMLDPDCRDQDMLSLIKSTINHFNTDQRKMLNESILTKEFTPLEAYNNTTIKQWAKIFEKFNRLPLDRKNKFYSNCS